MRYLSIDIETTGLDETQHEVLEVGAIIEDTDFVLTLDQCPKFRVILNHGDDLFGNVFALSINANLIQTLAHDPNHPDIIKANDFEALFLDFLNNNHFDVSDSKVTPAGKNFASFDRPFLKTILDVPCFKHRTLDPGPLYFNPDTDDEVPNTATCLERAGLRPTASHTAIGDAWDVIRLIRFHYTGVRH